MKKICFILVTVLFSLVIVAGVALAAEDASGNSPYYGTIAGQVRVDSTTGAVYSRSGALVAAWRVESSVAAPLGSSAASETDLAVAFLPQSADQFIHWTTTDQNGNYQLADLPPGTYFLAAAAQEAASAWFKPALGGTVKVTAGQVITKDLVLDGPYGAFGGRVTNLLGNSIAQATVVALPRSGIGVTARLASGAEITAEAQGEVTIQQDSLKLRLKVRAEGESQAALTREQASLLTHIAYYQTRTDANGYYHIPFVRPGAYWILAFKNRVYDLQEAEVKAQQLTPADFRLPLSAIVVEPQPPGLPPAAPPPAKGQPGPPDKIKIFIRGQLFDTDVPPVLENGRILLPLRELVEALGATVTWDGQGKGTVAIKKGEITVKLQIQSKVARKNGKALQIDVPAKVHKGRTMVPARFLSQSLGAEVRWDASSNSVWIE